jgi:non-specific protein-tyrosine kinase
MLRAQMRYFDVDRDISRVLVSSADGGEGKTTIALNLARAAGSAGDMRTLLIEADLRRPALGPMLGMSRVAGLSELLSQSHDIAQGLHELVVTREDDDARQAVGGHDILLAGATPPNPVELLESRRMAELLDYADSIYDLVILDTPPIGVVSDPVSLVHRVDGVLVVSRLGRSRRDHAARLMKQLRALNANILGVVVNGAQAGLGANYGYYEFEESNGKSARRKWSDRRRQGSDVT